MQPQGEHYFAHPPFFVMLLIPFRSVVCNSQLDSREVQWILIVLNFNEILKNQLQQRATMQRQQQKCINIQNRDYTNQLQPFSHLAVPCIPSHRRPISEFLSCCRVLHKILLSALKVFLKVQFHLHLQRMVDDFQNDLLRGLLLGRHETSHDLFACCSSPKRLELTTLDLDLFFHHQ